ncbi:MAG: LamG-like jellyroll fold domain-containing protein [Verrucomicrobiales bacterium]
MEIVSNQVWADNVTLNQWHHIQILFDGTDQVQFYLDGSLLGGATRQPHFQRNNAWVLELGHFDGDLDELRISSVVREVSDPPAPGGGGSDAVKPSVAISAVVQQQVNAPFPVSVNFSEAVSGLSESKFQIHNGSLAGLSGSGASYNNGHPIGYRCRFY